MISNHQNKKKVKSSIKLSNWVVSGFYFALTFVFFNYLGHALTSLIASHFGYQATFSYVGMDTLMYTTGWTANRIGAVYVLPSVICLVIGTTSYFVYRSLPKLKIHSRVLFVWLAFNGFNFYFSHILTGLFSGFDFNSQFFTAFVSWYAWLGLESQRVMFVLTLQALFSAPFIYFLVRPFHELSYSNQLMVNRNAGKKWREFLFCPMLIGTAVVVLATFPMDVKFSGLRLLSALLLSLLMLLFMNFRDSGSYKIVKGGFFKTPKWIIGAFVVMLIIVCQSLLRIQIEL